MQPAAPAPTLLTQEQKDRLNAFCDILSQTSMGETAYENVRKYAVLQCGVDSLADLTESHGMDLIDMLEYAQEHGSLVEHVEQTLAWDKPAAEPVAEAASLPEDAPILDYALDAIRRGFHIAPCHPRAKEPATHNGVKDATNNEAQVRAWWAENPDYNYLIATGASGIVVRDYDKVAPFADKPATLRIQTGREQKNGVVGVQDYYRGTSKTYSFRADGQRKLSSSDPNAFLRDADGKFLMEPALNKEGQPIIEKGEQKMRKVANPDNASVGEVRGDYAYVIGYGSIHPSGNRYKIISDVDMAQLPAEDVKAITPFTQGDAVGSDAIDKIAGVLEESMQAAGIEFNASFVGAGGEYKWYVECPWWTQHSDNGKSSLTSTSALILWADGKIIYKCQHGHCEHRMWHEGFSQTNPDLYLRDFIEDRIGKVLQFHALEMTHYEATKPVGLNAGAPVPAPVVPVEPVADAALVVDGVPATWQFPPSFDAATENEAIPAYNPAIEDGYFKEVVDAVCNGTTIPRQFMHNLIRAFVGALASDFLRFENLNCNSSRYSVNLGESGTGKRLVFERGIRDIFEILYKDEERRKVKMIESADSGAGLRDAFFDTPRNAPIFMMIDEAASLANKANEAKNPEIVDAVIELADSTIITRVKAAKGKKNGGKAVRQHDDARLSMYICAQHGEVIRTAFAGRKKQGIDERLNLEYSPKIEGGDLPTIPGDVKLALVDKLIRLLDKMGSKGMLFMTATDEAKGYVAAYWAQQPKEVREKIRLRRNLWLDIYMRAFSRGETVATLEDAQRVAEHFERDKSIRRVHFRGEISSKIGLYVARLQKIFAGMRAQLNRGVAVPLVALSKRDLQTQTHAFDDNELDIFDRAFKSYAIGNLWEVRVDAANGHSYTKFIPIAHEHENWTQLLANSVREVVKV
jgi:hypothetical protein